MKIPFALFTSILASAILSHAAWAGSNGVGRKFTSNPDVDSFSTSSESAPASDIPDATLSTEPVQEPAKVEKPPESSKKRDKKSKSSDKAKKAAPVVAEEPFSVEIKKPSEPVTAQPADNTNATPANAQTAKPVEVERLQPVRIEAERPNYAAPVEAVQSAPFTQTSPALVENARVNPPANLNTSSTAPSASIYTLQAGDMLHISVWREEELDREVLVMPDGTIDFPLIGSFSVIGKTTLDVQRAIKEKMEPFITESTVTVVVKEARGNAVSVIGQVTRPGEVIMTRALTVMQALSQAGGLTPYADDNDIVILRKRNGKEESIDFDYSDIARGANLESNITLLPGDVIVVPTQGLF